MIDKHCRQDDLLYPTEVNTSTKSEKLVSSSLSQTHNSPLLVISSTTTLLPFGQSARVCQRFLQEIDLTTFTQRRRRRQHQQHVPPVWCSGISGGRRYTMHDENNDIEKSALTFSDLRMHPGQSVVWHLSTSIFVTRCNVYSRSPRWWTYLRIIRFCDEGLVERVFVLWWRNGFSKISWLRVEGIKVLKKLCKKNKNKPRYSTHIDGL